MLDSAAHGTRRHRPRAVAFVASLLLFEALLVVLAGVLAAAAQVPVPALLDAAQVDAPRPLAEALPGLGLAATVVVAGGGLALAALGLLRLREWGWVLAMALQGIALGAALYTHLNGPPQHLPLAVCSLVVLVLNQREVRQAFTGHREHE